MTSCQWSILINALGIAIAAEHTPEELAFYSILLSQLGTTLALLAITPPCMGGTLSSTAAEDAASGSAAGVAGEESHSLL